MQVALGHLVALRLVTVIHDEHVLAEDAAQLVVSVDLMRVALLRFLARGVFHAVDVMHGRELLLLFGRIRFIRPLLKVHVQLSELTCVGALRHELLVPGGATALISGLAHL